MSFMTSLNPPYIPSRLSLIENQYESVIVVFDEMVHDKDTLSENDC